jgi:SAM-dependent methyltransferase
MNERCAARPPSEGRLGDTADRDYSRKLELFNAFAEPELRRAIADLGLLPEMRILDAGCGTGEAMHWLWEPVAPGGSVIGIDLATAHVRAARRGAKPPLQVLQGSVLHAPFARDSFDLIWCCNTLHHLRDPLEGLRRLAALLRPGGRVALCQSSLLPDMYFAWDARLERLANEAVRSYYQDRYGIDERNLAAVRSLVGLLHEAQLRNVTVRTLVIERTAPLSAADRAYLLEAIFRNTWGSRLRPYLSRGDHAQLERLCDPADPQFALRRRDFHFLQTLTLAVAET